MHGCECASGYTSISQSGDRLANLGDRLAISGFVIGSRKDEWLFVFDNYFTKGFEMPRTGVETKYHGDEEIVIVVRAAVPRKSR